jgi:hypothetical protein
MAGKQGAGCGKSRQSKDASTDEEWSKSKCLNSDLLRLVREGLLQLKEVV